jgi:two-component system, response regulator PdtaR
MAGLGQTVLLIEDEAIIRMGTCAMLEDGGFRVLEAANADEAHGLIAAHPEIVAVITDVQMPGSMDGLEFVTILSREYAHIPVIITSGRTGREEARDHGAAIYVSKPYTAKAIHEALNNLIE